MADSRIELDEGVFASSFPFSFVVGEAGKLELVGTGLRRRLGDDPTVHASFEVILPAGTTDLRKVAERPGTPLLLRVADSSLELKGHAFPIDGGTRYAVITTPVARSLDQIRETGLQLLDFPPSDPTPDLLLSMQATKTALTDARALSDRLEKALAEAHAAVEAKSRFLAVMSHEIRTPMNGLGSMVDLLQQSDLTLDQASLVQTIDECARTLHVLVDDILDLSKLEAHSVELDRKVYDPESVVRQAFSLFSTSAADKGLEADVILGPGVPKLVVGDSHRVRQVLMNLVGNAVKFTERGSVTIELSRDGGSHLAVTVADTGIGIPEGVRDTLFQPFTQADSSTTRNYGGTGLGLAISRELARVMDGDVQLVDSVGEGTTFRFRFGFDEAPESEPPAPLPAPQTSTPEDPAELAGRRILVAEDNPTNRLIAQRLLKKLGVDVEVAEDGAQAIEAVAESAYDLVLMDLMMPNVDGPTAARAIRQLDVPWSDLPIVAFTAGAFDCDREVAGNAGMEGFLEKPVRLDRLREVLSAHLRDARVSRES